LNNPSLERRRTTVLSSAGGGGGGGGGDSSAPEGRRRIAVQLMGSRHSSCRRGRSVGVGVFIGFRPDASTWSPSWSVGRSVGVRPSSAIVARVFSARAISLADAARKLI